MDLLSESVRRSALNVRASLGADSDLWLAFCGLVQLPRYDLNAVLEGKRQVNPGTLVRIAVMLEHVGLETRLRGLDPVTRKVLQDYGFTKSGELKEYFPHAWDRASLQRLLCRDEALPVPMLERIHDMVERLNRGEKISPKPKVSTSLVSAIKHELKKGEQREPATPVAVAGKPQTSRSAEGQRSAAESGVVALNALATLFSTSIIPQQVSDRTRQDAALAITRILNAFGVSR